MADMTPKKQMTLAEKLKVLNKVAENINTKAKKKVVGFISDPDISEKLRIKFIPTKSQNLNTIMGGGYPIGRISVVTGEQDSGKTSNLAETIGFNMQRDPNFVAVWLESESSLSKDFLCETFGIDPDRFFFIEHERQGAGEAAIDSIEAVLGSGAVNMVVINSLKCLVPSEEFKKQMGEFTIGSAARMNAKMVRKITSIVAENEVAFVIITHLTTQIGNMYEPLTIAGGRAILYASMLTLDFRKHSIQQGEPVTREEGMKIGVAIKKNHCVPRRNPYLKTEYYIIYGQGTEQYIEALTNAVAQGILIQSGSFIKEPDADGNPKELSDGTKLQWQGKTKFREYCIANPAYFEELLSKIRGEVVNMTDEEIEIAKQEEEKSKEGSEDVIEEVKKSSKKLKKNKEE